MTGWREVEYVDVAELRGPLLVLRGAARVGWDEFATIRLPGGGQRHGLVLEVDRDLVVVQVLEGTEGLAPAETRVAFAGSPLHIPVGTGWLGRVCNGRGEPIDGGPPVFGAQTAPVAGWPLNPTRREPPSEPVFTGVSVIDALTTLARGQKLPVFSVPGLPHLELAAQIAAQATAGGEPFSVVFAGMGLTHPDADFVRDRLEDRSAAGELALLLNTADDPPIERILTPRLALTIAEHLAFAVGRHVLVVMADMTSYCEALREVSAARGEIPARRAYPGYLYSDLASVYERCGRIRGRPGSVTVVPLLTMPAGDITHPVPDLTGYITEGQVVLSTDVAAHRVYPPVDPLASLSRLMRHGAGPDRTREDHLDLAAQVLAALARARAVRELAELVGASALSATDQRYLTFAEQFEHRLVDQRPDEIRSLDETLDRAWQALSVLPRRELTMLPAALLGRQVSRGRPARRRRAVSGRRGPAARLGSRLWLRRRQAAAERAAELLDVRLRLLHQERERFTLLAEHTGEDWQRTCTAANRWLLRAALLGHRRAIRLADDRGVADVELQWNTVMGVRYPAAASITLPAPPPPDSPSAGTAALVEAAAATQPALQAAVRHAAAAAALRAIDAELAVTRRRLHAINERWLPRLSAAASAARLEADEQERAEAARLHWAAGRRAGPVVIERILLAVDDSAGSVAAIRVAVGLAAACGASLDILTVVGDAVAAEALATATSSGQVLLRRERAASAVLRHAAEVADHAGVPAHPVQLCGEPARLILSEARRCRADLIVIGRAGRAIVPGAPYVGSHTRQVLEFAEQPVLVVPPVREIG